MHGCISVHVHLINVYTHTDCFCFVAAQVHLCMGMWFAGAHVHGCIGVSVCLVAHQHMGAAVHKCI